MDIEELIIKRIEQLSKKKLHYVINLGEMEGIKIYHDAGKEDWCVNCGKIRELKRLLKRLCNSQP